MSSKFSIKFKKSLMLLVSILSLISNSLQMSILISSVADGKINLDSNRVKERFILPSATLIF